MFHGMVLHVQVRSIASETARQAAKLSQGRGVDLDWYVIDTREELSAFDGVLLERQADFALQCLRHLAASYGHGRAVGGADAPSAGAATSSKAAAARQFPGIFLVGHSMGGVVARATLLMAEKHAELGKACPGPALMVLCCVSVGLAFMRAVAADAAVATDMMPPKAAARAVALKAAVHIRFPPFATSSAIAL